MSRKLILIVAMWAAAGSWDAFAGGLQNILYVNKRSYLLNSEQESEISLKYKSFEVKHPGKLKEYRGLAAELERLSLAVEAGSINDGQKNHLVECKRKMTLINMEIGDDFAQTRAEIERIQQESEWRYKTTLKALLDETGADAINSWREDWYYLAPDYDATDRFLDKLKGKSAPSFARLRKFNPKDFYFVDRAALFAKSWSGGMEESELWKKFYRACKTVGRNVGADLISDISQSGFEGVNSKFDLTEEVSAEMRKLAYAQTYGYRGE